MSKIKFIWLLSFSCVWANFSLEPFVVVLRGQSGQLTDWITLKTNQDVRPVPVELIVHERIIDAEGKEVLESPESKMIMVYPSQMVLYPGEETRVQVTWAGKNRPDRDMVFTLVAEEVPVKLPNADKAAETQVQTSMTSLVRYRAVIAVETGKAGRLVAKGARIDSTGRKVAIEVENTGLGRVSTDGINLIIRGVKYTNFEGANTNSIMPGEKRRFLLEIPFIPQASEIKFGY